ncbi:MAG: DUF1501 domain-containing protein [Pirellulales bacterium]|nr:DUF1501 domain-containing protein [Pirellulales bacterium]
MLDFIGCRHEFCDGVSRRDLLKVGALGLGGLTLPGLLRARATAAAEGREVRRTSVIYIELAGGPSHFETYDPKPTAPREYRGPLGSVATKLPGVRFSECMTEQAKIADRLAIIRSVQHESSSHETSAHLVQTGYYLRDRQNRENEMPCIGAVAARLRGANVSGVPAYVAVPNMMRSGAAAYLGKGFNAFETGGDPNKANFRVNNLSLVKTLSLDRLESRRTLLAALDSSRRVVDNRGVSGAMDNFTSQAFELVTGDRAREAFAIEREKDKARDRYGRTTTGQSLLLARRLVESGVGFVTVRVGSWDDHTKIKDRILGKAPALDRGVAALVKDLQASGLDQEVLVVAMGEFGRTPRVNKTAGRDHWGSVMSVLVAGGGLKMGQVIGSSNRKGEIPQSSPYRPEHVLAMVYRHLGIDPEQTFNDLSGRPRYILERRELIKELLA